MGMLEGWKTIIAAGAAFVTAIMGAFGYMDQATAAQLEGLLVPLALIFLRMGVQKAEDAKPE